MRDWKSNGMSTTPVFWLWSWAQDNPNPMHPCDASDQGSEIPGSSMSSIGSEDPLPTCDGHPRSILTWSSWVHVVLVLPVMISKHSDSDPNCEGNWKLNSKKGKKQKHTAELEAGAEASLQTEHNRDWGRAQAGLHPMRSLHAQPHPHQQRQEESRAFSARNYMQLHFSILCSSH